MGVQTGLRTAHLRDPNGPQVIVCERTVRRRDCRRAEDGPHRVPPRLSRPEAAAGAIPTSSSRCEGSRLGIAAFAGERSNNVRRRDRERARVRLPAARRHVRRDGRGGRGQPQNWPGTRHEVHLRAGSRAGGAPEERPPRHRGEPDAVHEPGTSRGSDSSTPSG